MCTRGFYICIEKIAVGRAVVENVVKNQRSFLVNHCSPKYYLEEKFRALAAKSKKNNMPEYLYIVVLVGT